MADLTPEQCEELKRELRPLIGAHADITANHIAPVIAGWITQELELGLAMHQAYRPEVVAEIAVHLGSHADWDELAKWCGGRIESSQDPSGEWSSTLVLPNGESGGDWAWLVLNHAGVSHRRAEVEQPSEQGLATLRAEGAERRLADRPDGMPGGIEAASVAAAQAMTPDWDELPVQDKRTLQNAMLPVVLAACRAQIAALRESP